MAVFVLDKQKIPLMPCSEKRARQLLTQRRAVVHRHCPFTIRLKDRVGGETQAVQIKIDPGSKVTGIAAHVSLSMASEVFFVCPIQIQPSFSGSRFNLNARKGLVTLQS